jgi:ABC-type glutathione transport system ATPase component
VRNYEASVTSRISDDDVVEEGERIDRLVESDSVHEDIVVVHSVFKRFQRKLPIRGISFGVHYGECLGILGVTGAGKTLLFKIISGKILSHVRFLIFGFVFTMIMVFLVLFFFDFQQHKV